MSTATTNQVRATELEQELDLTFLATGEYQHVFVRAGAEDDPWVYKIPAAFGFVLPFDQEQRFFWPQSLYEKALWWTLVTLPKAFEACMSVRTSSTSDARPAGISRAVRRAGERLAALHCRRVRQSQFNRMLGIIEYVEACGLKDILLPSHSTRLATIRLHVDGQTHPYRGPLLVQRKAALFEAELDLATFTWNEVVEAQHRLWKQGIGVFGCLEMLGARSWSLLDGRVFLADTSALTRDARRIRGSLERATFDETSARALRMLQAAGCGGSAKDYLKHVRGQITPARFDQLWCSHD